MGFETKPLRFEREGAAAGEWVVECRQPVAVEELRRTRIPLATQARLMSRVRGAGPPPALPDLGPRPLQHLLVGGVLPQHQVLDDCKEPVALQLRNHFLEYRFGVRDRLVIGHGPPRRMCHQALVQLPRRGAPGLRVRQQHVDIFGRVVDHLRKDDGPRRRQWSARPPQMQRARMPVANRLLPGGRLVDGVERQSDLDELLAGAAAFTTCSTSAGRTTRYRVPCAVVEAQRFRGSQGRFAALFKHLAAAAPSKRQRPARRICLPAYAARVAMTSRCPSACSAASTWPICERWSGSTRRRTAPSLTPSRSASAVLPTPCARIAQ